MFTAHAVRRGLVRLQRLWAERRSIDEDALWHDLVERLSDERSSTDEVVRPPRFGHLQRAARMASMISATGFTFGRNAVRHVPKNAVYVNVGHISLAMPIFLRWLDARPDVTPVFMLHDVIPLETPEYVSAPSAKHHATMVASTARHAAGLLVSTDAAQKSVTEALARFGRTDLMTLAQPLPLPRAFSTQTTPDPALAGIKYFVICGAIEPRKNHALLLDVWRKLITEMGDGAPHLVISGSPGWRSQSILSQLHDDLALQQRIHVVSGLSSPSLKRLLCGAVGLLMPSYAEGFGLPLIEASQLGIPVIASDIPAHREVAAEQALLLGPSDRPAWGAAIRKWTQGERPAVQPQPIQHSVDNREAYFAAVQDFFVRCAEARRGIRMPEGGRTAPPPPLGSTGGTSKSAPVNAGYADIR
ncbi:glycosyltransferase family 4 protein [Xanthobacteraceae bacterium A53D]